MKKLIYLINTNKILFLILFVATVLRFGGVKPGYNQFHPDEPILYGRAVAMIKNENLDPGRFDYPSVSIYTNYILYRLVFIPVGWVSYYADNFTAFVDGTMRVPKTEVQTAKIFQTKILGPRDINALYWGRYVTAAFGVGVVFLIYLLGKKLFNRQVGYIAAFFLIFNFRHTLNSHLVLPDIYNSFFLVLAILTSVNLWKKPSGKNYLIAAIVIGVSLSTKYQIFAIFPFGLAHLYATLESQKGFFKKLLSPSFVAAIILIPLVFILLNPYFFIDIESAYAWLTSVSGRYAVGSGSINLYPVFYLYNHDLGPIEFFIAFLGVGLALISEPKKALLLLSVLVSFGVVFLYFTSGVFVRNLAAVNPILIVFAAYLIWRVYEVVSKRFAKLSIFFLIFTIPAVIYIPARNSILSSYYHTKKWNIEALKSWQKDHLPKNIKIAAHPFDPVIGPEDITRTEFELRGNYSLNEHKEAGAEWALLNLNQAANSFYFWMNFSLKDLKNNRIIKPLDSMRKTYHAIASEELIRYQVFSATKPWQSPDTGYVMTKLPHWPEVEMLTLAIYSAEDKAFSSELINVNPGHLYKITGSVRADKELSERQRDGYFQISFYEDKPLNVERIGMLNSVSSRVYGPNSWQQKELLERAPDNARYLVISFHQQSQLTSFEVGKVLVEESKEKVENMTKFSPYIKNVIDLNLLYPNSIGNL